MPSLADLVLDLPPRVQRALPRTRDFREEVVNEPYSDEVHEQWLRDLDREAQLRGEVLPVERAQRRVASPEELQEGILADLLHEMRRQPKGVTGEMATGWGQGQGKWGDHEAMPDPSPVRGPAPVSNEGVLVTLKSYLEAKEPCDRFDALIRHAATTLLLAEQVATGNA